MHDVLVLFRLVHRASRVAPGTGSAPDGPENEGMRSGSPFPRSVRQLIPCQRVAAIALH
jgi:hypothetical protein